MVSLSARPLLASAGALLLVWTAGVSSPLTQGASGDVVALTGARLIDGTGRAPVERAAIVLRGGRIVEAGAADRVRIPDGAARVDLTGRTVVPGIVNAHGHLNAQPADGMSAREDLVRRLRMYAMYGVTTVVSLGSTKGDEAETFRLRDEQENAPLDRARVYSSGLVVNDPSADAARRSVARLAGAGADFIKFRLNGGPGDMAPDTWGALVDEAKRRSIPTAVHVFYLQDAKAAVARGVDVIAHSVRDQDVDPAFIAALKQGNIAYIPTLTRELSVFAYESTPAFFADPFFRRGFALYEGEVERLSDPAAQARVRENPQSQAIKKALEQANRNLATLAAAGVPIALGTDSGAAGAPGRWQGYFEHVELEMMVRAGLSPRDAVVAATAAAARAMRLEDVGTIEPGKWGDLLVLRGNPLDDIMHMRQIDAVWIAGRQMSF